MGLLERWYSASAASGCFMAFSYVRFVFSLV